MKLRQSIRLFLDKLRQHRWLLLAAPGLCTLVILLGLSSKQHPPVIETITTEGSPQAKATPRATVNAMPQLPQRDVDVEVAGDHIAAAAAYLKNRQSAAALRALTQAGTVTSHAIERRKQTGKRFDMLEETLREIDSVERSVQHGALGEARTHLISLNKKLDDSLEH
jgi:hypothetical protein